MFSKYKDIAISKIKKSNSFVLSTGGTIAITGDEIDVMSDIVFLINGLYKNLPQENKQMILSAIITHFKCEEEISTESEELAEKILNNIKELKK